MEGFLDGIEKDFGVKILFAIDGGSRNWGTHTEEHSDFDVRFVFVGKPLCSSSSDTLERKEEHFDGHGWSVSKAVQLAGNSNGALVEWLRSTIIYRDPYNVLPSWRAALLPRVAKRQLVLHYHSLLCRERKLCVGGRREIEDLKGYLHCVRPALCAEYLLLHQEFPPVLLADLLAASQIPPAAREYLEALVRQKQNHGKLGAGPHFRPLDEWMDSVEAQAKAVAKDWGGSSWVDTFNPEHLIAQAGKASLGICCV